MTTTMKEVFGRLKDAGYGRKFVKEVALPSWWEPAVVETRAGLDQTLLIISRRLGLSFEALRTPGQALAGLLPDVRFKADKDVAREDLSIPAAVGAKLARLVLRGTPRGDDPAQFADPTKLRETILAEGAPWVGLEELVTFCWRIGIPVIHVTALPKTTKGKTIRLPAGMAIKVGDRHAIVLCRQDKYESKHLFNVAHEAGHIMCGHIADGVLVDDDVDRDSTDPQEQEANDYAIKLLCGKTVGFVARSQYLSGEELATSCLKRGKTENISPGHIAFNYAHTMTQTEGSPFFPSAYKALNILGEGKALKLLASKLEAAVDWDELSDDDEEFVRRLVGLDPD